MNYHLPSLAPLTAFKKFSLLAVASLFLSATAPATTNQFNPTLPLNVVDQGGFTGSFTPDDPYDQARVIFTFTGLNPSPLSSSFSISNISLEGPGITTSLSFSDVSITANGNFFTDFVNLNTNVPSLNFVDSLVSFSVPGGVINDGATLRVLVNYNSTLGIQNNSSSGVFYSAVPEPSTYALLALTAAGLAAHRWRKRSKIRG